MSYMVTKPDLVSVLYLSMRYMVLLFIMAPFYVLLVQGPRLQNDLYCVEWDVKLYYTIPYHTIPYHTSSFNKKCHI